MDERFIQQARERIEARARTFESLGQYERAASERTQDVTVIARRMWAEAEAQKPEVIAAFLAEHPGYEAHPEDPWWWESRVALNQDDVDAWDANFSSAFYEAENSQNQTPGATFTASDGSVWRRNDTRWSPGDRLAVPQGATWKRIGGTPRPERDFGGVSIVDWFLSRSEE